MEIIESITKNRNFEYNALVILGKIWLCLSNCFNSKKLGYSELAYFYLMYNNFNTTITIIEGVRGELKLLNLSPNF